MQQRRFWTTALAGSLGLLAMPALASDEAVSDNEIIEELRTRVGELEARLDRVADQDDWLTEERADEIRSIVEDVLADADTRASMLQGGSLAGYDGGFFITSPDGNFLLELESQVQVRYIYNSRDASDYDPSEDDNQYGFEIRRAKLKWSGHVIDPSWKYAVQGGFDRKGGAFELEDALIGKDFGNGWEIQFGQQKLPFNREELVSSKRQLAVDRSLTNEFFNKDRSAGVMVKYDADQFRVAGMVSNGGSIAGGTVQTPTLNSSALAYDTEFAITARGEWLIRGDWGQFKDLSSKPGSDYGVMLGGAVNYQQQEYGVAAPSPKYESFAATADVSVEGDGWNVFAAILYEDIQDVAGLGGSDASPLGFVVQGGFFLTEGWEAFARYEYTDLDVSGVDDISILTAGVNNHINSKLKWTTDIGYGFDPAPIGSSGVGWEEDAPNEDGQVVVRSQLQLVF